MRKFFLTIAMFLLLGGLALAAESRQVAQVRQKAEAGDAASQEQMAIRYETGEGVKRDFNEAVRWYQRAAESGSASAQSTLGWFYQNGQGVGRDPAKAVELYRKSAEQGDPYGQLNLAVLLDEGVDIPVDKQEAIKWYRKSAEQGQPRAQLNLGVMYWEGDGVEKDLRQAWEILNLVRMTSRDKQAQWKARGVLDKIKHELGVDRPDGIGRFAYPKWEVLEKAVRKPVPGAKP